MSVLLRGSELRRLGRLIRKELSTILRDRRTIITLVLMPVLVYPLLTIGFRQSLLLGGPEKHARTVYHVGFRSEDELRIFTEQFVRGDQLLKQQRPEEPEGKPVEIVNLQALEPEKSLHASHLELAIHVRPSSSGFAPGQSRLYICELIYLRDSLQGQAAKEYVERRLEAANNPYFGNPLLARPRVLLFNPSVAALTGVPFCAVVRPAILAVRVKPLELPASGETIPLSVLLPLILILMTMTGAVYPAIDLTAGERERGTLEVLVAAPVPRLALLFAKYVSVLTVAVLTAVVNLVTMTLTLQLSGLGGLVFGQAGLPLLAVVQVFGLLLLFASFFSAVLLIVTCFARSFKEAQAYLIPLMLVSMTPGMLSLLPGLKLEGFKQVVPLLNIVLLTRDVLEGTATLATGLLVVLSTLVYALAAIALAARIFGAEAVLYNEQGGWSDLFRRPALSHPAPTLSAALFCLAIMFPISFVLIALLGHLARTDLYVEMIGNAAGNVVLFLGLPLAFAWMGRVRLREGFRVEQPAVLFWGAALLLGLSLWPFGDALQRGLRWLGVATLSDEVLGTLQETAARWRGLSPLVFVLGRGVVPALFEELFFRGFLLGALLRTMRPRSAILTSAAFFGLFHLVDQQLVIVERAIASTLLGLVLGWLAWRSGSVVPGMVLHATNNGCLLLLLYYQPGLIESGWLAQGQQHLPPSWLLAAAATGTLALLWLWFVARGGVDRETPID